MKKFKFQLETLLKVTKMKKEDAEAKFAEATRYLTEARDYMSVLLDEMQQGQHDYENLSKEGKSVTVGTLMTFNSFFAWKRSQIEGQQKVILEARSKQQQRLKELQEVMSYLKSIEQLKEKRWQEYKDELMFEEQKMLDEIGLQLTMRARRLQEARGA